MRKIKRDPQFGHREGALERGRARQRCSEGGSRKKWKTDLYSGGKTKDNTQGEGWRRYNNIKNV